MFISVLGFSQYTRFEMKIASSVNEYRYSRGLGDINFLPSLNDKLDFLLERVVEANSLWNSDGGTLFKLQIFIQPYFRTN